MVSKIQHFNKVPGSSNPVGFENGNNPIPHHGEMKQCAMFTYIQMARGSCRVDCVRVALLQSLDLPCTCPSELATVTELLTSGNNKAGKSKLKN